MVVFVRELIGSHPSNFAIVMRGVVNNELGQWHSVSNMALISMMVHSWPEEAAKVIVCVCVSPPPPPSMKHIEFTICISSTVEPYHLGTN